MLKPRWMLAALVAGLLGGCGGGNLGGNSTSQPLPDLQGRAVTVAVETSAPPFSYVDIGGNGSGWDYDTVQEICRRLNCNPRFQQTPFQGVFDAVHAGQFDMLADGVTVTSARQQLVSFSTSYATINEVLLVRVGELESLDLFKVDATKVVGAQAGTTNAQTAIDTFGAARVVTAATEPQVVSALLTGTLDGAVLDNIVANTFARGNPGLLETLGGLTGSENLAFAFPLNSTLLAPVNSALQSMMNDGTLRMLNVKWGVAS